MTHWGLALSEGFRSVVPLFLALALPFTLFVCRYVVRSQRIAVYEDLVRTLYPGGGSEELPQLEAVRTKYAHRTKGAARKEEVAEADLSHSWRGFIIMTLATALFAAFSFIGFQLLLTPKACLFSAGCADALRAPWLQDSLAWSAYVPAGGVTQDMIYAVTVMAVGFLGAYVATTQYLIRQLLNYELGAVSFLRSAFQLFMGLSVPLVAFRVALAIDLPFEAGTNGFAFWVGAAFFVGMAPQAGISWLSGRLKLTLEKRLELGSLESARIISVEVIDGIDAGIRFRLDEANITDVQNLATSNPIELYVETPYALLQVFDWVLQAQLCLVVGPEAFQKLRQHRVRTIFDLERAVLADGAPEAYVLALGDVVFSGADPAFLARVGGASGLQSAEIVRHAVAVMCDDLHVHRLRALWKRILVRSAGREAQPWLYRSAALPGDEEFAPVPFAAPPASPVVLGRLGTPPREPRPRKVRDGVEPETFAS